MGNLTIRDLPEEARPRERLRLLGAGALSDAELLAILIGSGTRSESALVLAGRVLKGIGGRSGLRFVAEASVEELSSIKGIGPAKSGQIKAAVELGLRLSSHVKRRGTKMSSPADVASYLMDEMQFLEKEHFRAMLLDIKNQLICIEDISVGSLNSSIVHPREVFKPAIRRTSASIILVHNHPSGDPTPSREDLLVTRRLVDAGKIIGIDVIDHVIIGNGSYVSLKEKGKM